MQLVTGHIYRRMLRISWICKRTFARIFNELQAIIRGGKEYYRTCHNTQYMRHHEKYHTRNCTEKKDTRKIQNQLREHIEQVD